MPNCDFDTNPDLPLELLRSQAALARKQFTDIQRGAAWDEHHDKYGLMAGNRLLFEYGCSTAILVALLNQVETYLTPEDDEKYNVILQSYKVGYKIHVIRALRQVTNLGLKEVKILAERAPYVIVARGVSEADAYAIGKTLEEAGATIRLEKA